MTPSSSVHGQEPGPSPALIDVSTIGEALLRLSVPIGSRLEDCPSFEAHVAGSEANVAFALARIGLTSSWTSALPRNPLGRRVAATLAAGGVDLRHVVWSDQGRLATYYVEFSTPPRPTQILYDRLESVMARAHPAWFDWEGVCRARVVHVSGITAALSASARAVTETAIQEARRRRRLASFDVNYRQRLWSAEVAAQSVLALAADLDVVISTAEDARDLFGIQGPPAEVVKRLGERLRVPTTVVTCGAEGAVALHGGELHTRPGWAVEPVDRIGAGDAFTAGLLAGLLEGSIEVGLERGLAMSALKMTLHGDLFRFSLEDVQAQMARAAIPAREVHR